MYPPASIANYFLTKGKEITPLKLQKLMYFAYGWHLAVTNKRLFNELIEAWKYGPVVPSVYYEFRHFGNNPIKSLMNDKYSESPIPPQIEDAETKKILDFIWNVYADFPATILSNITHETGSPWNEVTKEYTEKGEDLPYNKDIDDEIIKRYFSNELKSFSNAA